MEMNTGQTSRTLVSRHYLLPFILITSLFFLWGYARSILDVLNKHFQEALHITVAHSTLIQASTYIAYALMALPAGIIITRAGYRFGIITGLILFACGAFLFIPAASCVSFTFFLIALFVIGCGLAVLETAANPYASELGPSDTSASRLNIAQSLNGLGCILGPVTIGSYLFADARSSVAVPYSIMGCIVLLMVLLFSRIRLPEITPEKPEECPGNEPSFKDSVKALFSNKIFIGGVTALFFYEIAEISINSLFINYAITQQWLDKITATQVLSFGALGIFMISRILGGLIMSRVRPLKVLSICAVVATLAALTVAINIGEYSHYSIFICYASEAIIFPTIFALTISKTGCHSKIASSFMMMTPLGGAVGSILMGHIATEFNISTAFCVPAAGYLVVAIYSLSSLCINRKP